MLRPAMDGATRHDANAAFPAPLTVRVLGAVADVPQAGWDALVPDDARPFLSWDFLDVLEKSGSAVPERGWRPAHVTLWRDDALVAACPAYVKSHSMGEFFYNDFRWAQATPRFGVRYYPKLFVGVPFSPATASRLLAATDLDRRALVGALQMVARQAGLSSVNALFVTEEDLAALTSQGFHAGAGMQFHWENDGHTTFDGFLSRFNAKRRRMIRDERAQLAKDGTRLKLVQGAQLTPELMRFVSRCYLNTVESHAWNAPHLTDAFFLQVAERLSDRVEVVVAEEDDRLLASAFNLRGDGRLYGRVWGAVEERRFLHFNVCYYQSIERCVTEGLRTFEPGAGGEHKLARGFAPTLVHSAHWFVDASLHDAMGDHLARERLTLTFQVDEARQAGLAFKAGASGRFG